MTILHCQHRRFTALWQSVVFAALLLCFANDGRASAQQAKPSSRASSPNLRLTTNSAVPPPPATAPTRMQRQSEGTFADSRGARHSWSINGAHALLWESKPYLPVGALLKLRSWARDATEADWAADVAALQKLKSSNITDICLTPARGGLTALKPAQIQRTVDYLEANGFAYGLRINDGPRQPLIGYEVRPGAYRQEASAVGGLVRVPVEGAASALAFIVNETSGEIVQVQRAALVGEEARVMVEPQRGDQKQIVVVLPERIYSVGGALRMPDLWNGFDEYRDELIALLARVRLGAGFRFFADPLPADLALTREFERVVPTGTAWTTEWQVWLARRYKTIDSLQIAWGLDARDLDDFPVAASLLPLWNGSKGVQALYRRSDNRTYPIETRRSAFWRDLSQFKADSVRDYCNNMATALKKSVGDVPVVFSGSTTSAVFADLPANRGFDAIGMATPGAGRQRVLAGAANLYAHATEANKTLWIPAFVRASEADGYPNAAALNNDLDALREIGARAFFVEMTPELATETPSAAYLAGYASLLSRSGPNLAADAPAVLFYPRRMENIQTRQMESGVWLLPTDRPHTALDLGTLGRGYFFSDAVESGTYYLFNSGGPRTMRFRLPKTATLPGAARIAIGNSAVPTSVKNGVLTVTVGPDPIRLVNFPALPIPIEAFELMLQEAKTLAAYAKSLNRADAGRLDQMLVFTKAQYREDNPWPMYSDLLRNVQTMRIALRPYAWLEAEQADRHTYDEARALPGSSGGFVLEVGKRAQKSAATLVFNRAPANEKGTYQIWIAASPGARLTVRVDGQPLDDTNAARPAGSLFAEGNLVWASYGVVTLTAGAHTLEVRADGEAIVDSVLMTRGVFAPNGSMPPPVP